MRVPLRAWLFKSTIDLKQVQALCPDHYTCGEALLISLDPQHHVCVTSFGGLVFWPFEEQRARELAERIKPAVGRAELQQEVEDRLVVVTDKGETRVLFNEVWLADEPTPDHIGVIAFLLAQSVALESMELQVDAALDRFEAHVRDVAERGRVRLSTRRVLKNVGFAMQTRQAVLNDLALLDKPDITWEQEELEQLHHALHENFELEERLRTVSRKLDFLADNTSVLLEVLSTRKFLRLEWAIVILIALEIMLFGVSELLR